MEEQYGGLDKRLRRRRLLIFLVLLAVVVVITVAVVLGVTLRPRTNEVKATFLERCQKFKDYNCEKIWDAFRQAYVGRDSCNVPVGAYDALFLEAPFVPSCNRVMLWSKTKDVVHAFTAKRDCYVTLEDTMLGSVLDGLTWCGKEGSNETFTTDCPGWTECENNPVRSFWNQASAGFANAACGDVTVLLNGSIPKPVDPMSIFASIEVNRLHYNRVKKLKVVLVMQENPVANCKSDSLVALEAKLDPGMEYNCKEVPEAQIEECGSDPEKPCGSCW
ncbi:ADP-ribosyl cyclase/cyclic ADP-ribose hydrolase 1-like isoform X2 [Cololabis saira]|uniref:ADP-ribosyl cyclase/cyclic ADP-ribose hydrolase 1-like isoform X1 n=1 Tax=Cololabis saira TaxID=129043 RepID=UPI002AD29865|nr:ADP-ribosyl cyclase/cyclic ADP-ribose hydrolase 1-like isoform X1 [Cololabis saira]XP_061569337.1 ADP-ribosyl cyclase/cyclic ADP-ribose hydrolase 1-like isoform X2 [Cololabis saira]